jgi:hypothetical protein
LSEQRILDDAYHLIQPRPARRGETVDNAVICSGRIVQVEGEPQSTTTESQAVRTSSEIS